MASFSCEMFTSLFFFSFSFCGWILWQRMESLVCGRVTLLWEAYFTWLINGELAYTILLYCETENKIGSRKRESKEGEDGRRESNSL